jgi:hypothetical protein
MSVSDAVAGELAGSAAIATPEAQTAQRLSELLDAPDLRPSDAAAISRELRAVLAELRRTPAATTGDAVDQLRARRAKRHRA